MSFPDDTITDFTKAEFTAIISDLHLCEEEPVHPKYPLWKKYKTKEFFFDDKFEKFLNELVKRARGESVELILNGDIFDFDSVTSVPNLPPYQVSWLEKNRGLHPQEEKSVFKIKVILKHHPKWVSALSEFIKKGNRVIFTIGNHDLELYFSKVQKEILKALDLNEDKEKLVRFVEWFYISNGDTLIEHGNQYDPYCVCEDPINPYIIRFNRREIRIPFGNLATRYLVNGMGFFNPHLESNFIMTPKQYVLFFFKYMLRAQPFLLTTWLWGATVTLYQSFMDRLRPRIGDPLNIEDRVDFMAKKANATPRMVREMRSLIVPPAASYPLIIARELWLDRAFLVVLVTLFLYILFLQISVIFKISLYWMFIPFFLFLPFFIFYSKSVKSEAAEYKEPREKVLSMTGVITKVHRVVYGHTHIMRHENIGGIEHLNSGTWSPAFSDVECSELIGRRSYVWIYPSTSGRRAQLINIED